LVLAVDLEVAWGQSEAGIRGEVVAAADGSLLAVARVSLTARSTGEAKQVAADQAGRFTFQNVPPGEYLLAASFEGFRPIELRLVLEPREIRTVTLSLALGGVESTVDVVADARTIVSTHSPSSTFLTGERLEAAPLAQQTNLPDALVTAAPGMIRGHDDFVHIRGHEVALNPLINGVSFWENPHTLFSGGLSPTVVDSANVMTGGFPAEYGNRFGGVVDIVTKSGLRMQNDGTLALSSGQAGRRSVAADFGGHRDRHAYYAFGSMVESDRLLSPPDPTAIHDSGRAGHFFVQFDAVMGNAGSLRVLGMADGSSFEIPTTSRDAELRPLALAAQRTFQETTIVGWNRAWSKLAADASFYQRWSRTKLLPASGPLTARAAVQRDLQTIGGKASLTRFGRAHIFKTGVDVVGLRPREALAYDYVGYFDLMHLIALPHIHIAGNTIAFAGRESGHQVSAYAQSAFQLGSRITADAGMRLDRYDLLVSATHASPRVNVAFQAGGGVVFHASYNHFFVPPPIEGVLSSSAGLTQYISEIGSALPPIDPTTEDQFELGASLPAGPFHLALTGYYRATDNPVHTTVWPDARIYSYASFNRASAHGLEAKAEVGTPARNGPTGYINYALGRVYFHNPVTGGFVTEAEHLTATNRFLAPMDQTHTLTAGLTYRHLPTGFWVGTTMEYGSGTPRGHGGAGHQHAPGEADHPGLAPGDGGPRVPGHLTANASMGAILWRDAIRRARLSLQFDVENMTDHMYLVAQEGEFSSGQYSIPRLMSVTARLRF
jgi:hypothetical protein